MRLPQSIIRPLSVLFLHFLTTSVLLVFASGPLNALSTVPELSRSPSLLRFGNVDVGHTETLTVTLTNGGQSNVTVSEVSISDAAFATPNLSLPLVVPAGQNVEVSISFTPATTGWTPGVIKFLSNATNSSLAVQTGGSGVDSEAVTVKPASLSFGQVPVGGNSSLPLVLTNARTWNITISGIQITGAGFSISGATFPLTLSRGQSLALTVNYTPQSAGLAAGSMLVSGPGLCVPFAGTGTTGGTGQLSISPASLNYSNVPVGTTDTLPITVSATGASVTISSASSSSSQYVLTGASFPLTIAAGQSLSFGVAFTPQGSGTVSGSLSFSSTASDSQLKESLTGVGTVTPYSVSLSWNQSSGAMGYNVYRSASKSGSYSKLNPALDSNTAYSDSSVVSGSTYYYAATTVNSSGTESGLSTPVQVAVP